MRAQERLADIDSAPAPPVVVYTASENVSSRLVDPVVEVADITIGAALSVAVTPESVAILLLPPSSLKVVLD